MLYLDTPENVETAADAAIWYESRKRADGKLQVCWTMQRPEKLATRAKQRADALYRWEAIAKKYETLFRSC